MAEEAEKKYSKNEISRHTTDGDMWVIIDNAVYDLSSFQELHPGGKKMAGTDATKKYHKYHSEKAMTRYGNDLRIGIVEPTEQGKPKKSFFSKFRRS
ncbi:cytochrome b5-like heme/steroid binding domain-containing protein [Aspergillus ambiguus]|uniref:cytochrome b5-like heme/steroid binding domain-containing protein n=1 Tax=Aspergillus ambiguus TaxID=176160 RepID=UPI003CCD7841